MDEIYCLYYEETKRIQRAIIRFNRVMQQIYMREEADHLLDEGAYWE